MPRRTAHRVLGRRRTGAPKRRERPDASERSVCITARERREATRRVSGAQPCGCAPPRGGASVSGLSGLMGANVRVVLEVEADISDGAPENVVRTVTENSRTLRFDSHGFESE